MILGSFEDVSSPNKSTPKVHSAKASRHNEHSLFEVDASEDEVQEVNPDYDLSLVGWLYVGSHNFTPSAWGTLSGSSFTPVMNVRRYKLKMTCLFHLIFKDRKLRARCGNIAEGSEGSVGVYVVGTSTQEV